MFDQSLMDELIQREIKKSTAIEEFMPKEKQPTPQTNPMDPKWAMMLGGAADAASTYNFLRNGSMKEGNPAFSYLNKSPWTVIPTAAAAGTGYHFLHKFLKSKSPKIANTLAGLLGGFQMALGGNNFEQSSNNSLEAATNDLRVKK
jgi:hypothetical protein